MFDYAGWVQRAKEFTEGMERFRSESEEVDIRIQVEPPLTPLQMKRMAAKLEKEHSICIPHVLREFLTTASRNCACHYEWTPLNKKLSEMNALLDHEYIYGGPVFCSAAELVDLADFYGDEGAEYYSEYTSMLHFAEIGNGDSLALDLSKESDDPPVFYMCHDDESGPIASSFTSFLTAWEKLCYIGPEHWLLNQYVNKKKCLDGDSKKAQRLRKLFEINKA